MSHSSKRVNLGPVERGKDGRPVQCRLPFKSTISITRLPRGVDAVGTKGLRYEHANTPKATANARRKFEQVKDWLDKYRLEGDESIAHDGPEARAYREQLNGALRDMDPEKALLCALDTVMGGDLSNRSISFNIDPKALVTPAEDVDTLFDNEREREN